METENKNNVEKEKFLESLLYSNSERLVIKPNDRGKNPFIWSQFDIAYIDGIEQNFACCKVCKTFIKYTSRLGTGALMKHVCFRKHAFRQGKNLRKKPETTQYSNGWNFTTKSWMRLLLENLLHKNSPRIGYVRNVKGKSHIWSQFRIVTVDNTMSKYACCMLCRRIVSYSGRTGTGGMTRHKCKVKKMPEVGKQENAAAPVVTEKEPPVVIKKEPPFDWHEESSDRGTVKESSTPWGNVANLKEERYTPDIPEEVERVLQKKHAAIVNRTLRLFDVFENEEFLELAQFLVNLGAQYGPMDVKNIFKWKINLISPNKD